MGPVTIGAREIYDAVLRLEGSVGRMADHQQVVRNELADHEQRIRSGERLRWPLPSVSIAISILVFVLALIPAITGTAGKG
jgi:hypothetical protein